MHLMLEHQKIIRQATQLIQKTKPAGFSYEKKQKNRKIKEISGLRVDSKNPNKSGELRYHRSVRDQDDRRSGAYSVFAEVDLSIKIDKEGHISEVKKIKNNIELVFFINNGTVFDIQETHGVFRKKAMKLMRYRMSLEENEAYVFSSRYDGKALYVELKNHQTYKGVFLIKNFHGQTLDFFAYSSLKKLFEKKASQKEIFSDLIQIIASAACSIEILHQIGFSHGDIKQDNFIFYKESDGLLSVNVIDFGLSKEHNNDEKNKTFEFYLFQKMIFSFGKLIKQLSHENEIMVFIEQLEIAANDLYFKNKKNLSFQPLVTTCREIFLILNPSFSNHIDDDSNFTVETEQNDCNQKKEAINRSKEKNERYLGQYDEVKINEQREATIEPSILNNSKALIERGLYATPLTQDQLPNSIVKTIAIG